jgi:mono/diheme cytochrome c family protein
MVVLVLLVVGCADPLQDKFGSDLYDAGCAHCHGSDLSGGIGPDIGPSSNADRDLTDQQLFDVISVGPGRMPAFGRRLTDAQIASVVEYLRERQAE